MKGYYHSKMAFLCKPDVEAAIDNFRKAGNFYVEAADKYPQDDEHHACKTEYITSRLPNLLFLIRFPQLWSPLSLQVRNAAPRDTAHS